MCIKILTELEREHEDVNKHLTEWMNVRMKWFFNRLVNWLIDLKFLDYMKDRYKQIDQQIDRLNDWDRMSEQTDKKTELGRDWVDDCDVTSELSVSQIWIIWDPSTIRVNMVVVDILICHEYGENEGLYETIHRAVYCKLATATTSQLPNKVCLYLYV